MWDLNLPVCFLKAEICDKAKENQGKRVIILQVLKINKKSPSWGLA
jgi:hypothetical protein